MGEQVAARTAKNKTDSPAKFIELQTQSLRGFCGQPNQQGSAVNDSWFYQ